MLILFSLAVNTAAAATVTVDDSGGRDHTTIQTAVNVASAGDTILVYPGTYIENVDVTKQLTITSTGGAAATNVTAASSNDPVFNVTADSVTISGFNVSGATYSRGIYLLSSSNSSLTSNTVSDNSHGISLDNSSNSTVTNNTVLNSRSLGIALHYSSNTTLTNNTMLNSGINNYGIYLYSSNNNTISSSNTDGGIGVLYSSNYNKVTNNTVSNNSYGIYLWSSSNNTLTNNTALNNRDHGIDLSYSSYNTVIGNTASNNTESGIYLKNSNYNLIYNNHFNNTENTGFYGTNTGNIWNITIGNYWNDYYGVGFNDNGIGDTPYILNDNNVDYRPIITSFPDADFSTNTTSGIGTLVVQFEGLSSNVTSWEWDVNGDDKIDYTTQNPIHVYDTPGIYDVSLIVSNENGNDSKIIIGLINVSDTVSPVANFSANLTLGIDTLTVQFEDLSSNVTSWEWDVNGDNEIDYTTQNPIHVYDIPGIYNVTLNVNNGYAIDSKTIVGYITVLEPVFPVTNFSVNTTLGIGTLIVQFEDLSSNVTSWEWDVNGDSEVDYTTQNPIPVVL